MRLEQIIAWPPIAGIRPGKAEDRQTGSRPSRDRRGLAEGDVRAVEPASRRPDDQAPSGEHQLDIRV